MRKLNKKNKAYIITLSILTLILLGAVLVFIGFKFKDLNTKYDIAPGSVVYDSNDEILNIKEKTYAKKDLLGRYYVAVSNEKVNVGGTPVFFTSSVKELKLLGTFYEILKNGEVNKLKGETVVNSTAASRIFKIDDRKYLVIAPSIKSADGSLNASDYLHINIDKAGNGYLFNDEVNIKTFSNLVIITDGFSFNVNEELLNINDETIDLAKINGSTNEYEKPEEKPNDSGNSGSGSGNGNVTGGNAGDGEGTGSGTGAGSETIYPETPTVKPEPEVIDKYINRKTTIMSVTTTASTADINYVVFDPFAEYKTIYVVVSLNGQKINTYSLDMSATKYTVKDLRANNEYRFDFYYSYDDETGVTQNVLFDSVLAQTKNINGNITLEKTSNNSVRYILKIDSNYTLDSANVAMYIDGVLVATDVVNTTAASKDGFVSTITYDGSGSFGLLVLTDCIYNGAPVEIDASYKYKL
ncbi:MAG: hypothetical protein IJO63_02365 [Bacilli bacterium]|nr:hypothetical protein [Bacilli bacterium]